MSIRIHHNTSKGFTLLEVIISVAILGIALAFAVPNFLGMNIRARDREAEAMVRLIARTQDIMLEIGGVYIACATTGACNTALDLALPDPATPYWVYSVPNINNAAIPPTYCVQASHTTGTVRDCSMRQDEEDIVASGCP